MKKGVRDLIVIAVSAACLAVADVTIDLGLPAEFTPVISAIALAIYRVARDLGSAKE